MKLLNINVPFRDVLYYANEERETIEAEGMPTICINTEFILNRIKDVDSDKQTKGKKLNAKKRAMLAMYFGMLSIIGNKRYAATTSDFILCRMFGAKNEEELSTFREDEEFDKLYQTYATRRKYEGYMEELVAKKMITYLPYGKRSYISVKLKSDDALAEAIYKDSKATRRKEQRESQKAAIAKYLSKK